MKRTREDTRGAP